MYQNYYDTVQSGATEFSKTVLVNGIEALSYRGIPVIPEASWDGALNDIACPFSGVFEHPIVLTTADNLAIGTDTTSAFNQLRVYMDEDGEKDEAESQVQARLPVALPGDGIFCPRGNRLISYERHYPAPQFLFAAPARLFAGAAEGSRCR